MLDILLSIVFPIKCLGCKKYGEILCFECKKDIPPAERETDLWIFPIYDYRDWRIKKAISLLKYRGKKKMASVFAEVLYGAIVEELSELQVMQNFQNPLLVPIPLYRVRMRERGFNQAELICQEIIKINKSVRGSPLPISLALVKTRETLHQARIRDRKTRLENLKGTFAVPSPALVSGRNIILIDDVTTTGATLKEAKKMLKDAGARKIIAFTVAH